MIKTYKELREFDVKPYVEKRDNMDYLNWAVCKELLHKNGAEKVYFTPIVNEKGSSLFMSDIEFTDKNGVANRCYEVEVEIVIDDLVFNMRTPLMNGANPVKDNSMSQQRIWNAQARAFVKGVAIRTGLGFSLWLDDVDTKVDDDISKHNIMTIKRRVQEIYTQKLMKKLSTSEIADKMVMTEDEVKAAFTYYDFLKRFEENLLKL